MKRMVLGIMCAALAACGGPAKETKPVAVVDDCPGRPGWTCFKSGPCPMAEFRGMLCAVGQADSLQSQALGFEVAATQARGEMGAVLKSRVDTYTRLVVDSVSKAGYGEDAVQKVGRMSQNVVAETLVGVSVPKTWFHKEKNVYYAMAMVDSKTFVEALKGMGQATALSDQIKAEINQRAEGVVTEWETERDRLKGN